METNGRVLNYVKNEWRDIANAECLPVMNPATGQAIAQVPLSTAKEVGEAAQAAYQAYQSWKQVPPGERIQYLFKLKNLLEENFEELSRLITMECGKTLDESRGEMRRAIENVEVACGIPLMMQGDISEDIARGIDELMIRQPVGVTAIIAPFNFPGMIAFWFMPYALATGNTCIIKPSEKVPLTMQKVFRIMEKLDLPPGVLGLVNGTKEAVDGILDHPLIRAVSFVGSTPVAKYVYSRATANGKRAQCQGGAKNPIVIMPDADLENSVRIIADSAFGCAGQRCLASSLAVTIGSADNEFKRLISDAASTRMVGYGLDNGVQMGPVITKQSKTRIEGLIDKALSEGARPLVDGRDPRISGYENGFFVKPTILSDVSPTSEIAGTEVFGPVLGLIHAKDLDEAIAMINRSKVGNMACIFTSSGSAARKFRNEVDAGNVGINIGVAAPMAFFPFSGWKESFFGDLHGQSKHAVEFFTQTKVVVERWPKEWSRKF